VYCDGVQELVTTGTVTAGDLVVAATAGTVSTLAAVTTPTAADVTNSRAIVGVALTTATTGLKVQVKLAR
jgi:sulfate adenylyltransferase subunit 1 (EFTu-like GTPase family)